MLNTQEDVKSLEQRALRVASTAVLAPLALAIALIIEHTIRESCLFHIFGPCKERTQLEVEDGRGALLDHASKDLVDSLEAIGVLSQDFSDQRVIFGVDGFDGFQHQRDETGATCFDAYGDQIEPLLILGSGEGVEGVQVIWVGEVGILKLCRPVPETNRCKSDTWRELEVRGNLNNRTGYAWGQSLPVGQ